MQSADKEPIIPSAPIKYIHAVMNKYRMIVKITCLCKTAESPEEMKEAPTSGIAPGSPCECSGCSRLAFANIYDVALSLSHSSG